jgi:hypothetical protein
MAKTERCNGRNWGEAVAVSLILFSLEIVTTSFTKFNTIILIDYCYFKARCCKWHD